MNPGQKHYIKLFGIPTFKIKQEGNVKEIYMFMIPLLSVKVTTKRTYVQLLLISKLYDFFKSNIRKLILKRSNKKIFEKFKNGEKLKICLMVSRPGMWNFDYLYQILKNDERFEPLIVVMPDPFQGHAVMCRYIEETLADLRSKGYEPISGYDFGVNKVLNFRKEINPDIIFYSDFWKPHFCDEFYITNFLDKITLLNDYGFNVMQEDKVVVFELNNLVDIYFRQTPLHKEMAIPLMKNGASNIKIVGSPKIEPFFDSEYKPQDVWKSQEKPKKRIIWAPHHSRVMPSDMYCCNAFWEIYNYMLEVAQIYKDKVQIAFRPHPMLKEKIIKAWGEYIADEYFSKWEKLENTQVSSGDFIDLFMTSDAMIMDSCSFLAEYTATNKPLFYTRTKTSRLNLNKFGEELFENVYDTKDNLKEDIIDFIENVVLNDNDYKKEQRTQFVQKYFGKINGKMASENIYDEIIKFLEKGEV